MATRTTLTLETLLTDTSVDIKKLSTARIGNLADLAAKILTKPITTSVGEQRKLLMELKSTVLSWSKRDRKRLIDRTSTGAYNLDDLILNLDQRNLFEKAGIQDVIKEPGDDDLLAELNDSDDEDTTLELLHLMADSASPLRKRQIVTRYARRAAAKKRLMEEKAKQSQDAKKRADQMINSILYGVNSKVENCCETKTKSLKVDLHALEGATELTVQNQITKAFETVKAAEHMLRLGEAEPRLGKNQQLAIDYLKEVRAKNRETFQAIRERLRPHVSAGCKISPGGQLVHMSECTDQDLDSPDLIRGFCYGMTELQPAIRHALRVLFQRELNNISLDYNWVLTRSRIPKPEKQTRQRPQKQRIKAELTQISQKDATTSTKTGSSQ